MIANRLSVLLAERQLTIKDVVENTNLSRNTISNLINKNMNNSISMQTLNSLCMYLEIEPKDFFMYSPYDIKLSDVVPLDTDNNKFILMIYVRHYNDPKTILNHLYLSEGIFSSLDSPSYDVTFQSYSEDDDSNEDKRNLQMLTGLIDSLDIMFKKVLKDKIENHVISQISNYMDLTPANSKNKKNNKVINCDFSFPWHHSINIEYVEIKN